MTRAPTYSVVIPVFNEETGLEELYTQLCLVLDELDGPAEVILVDDGSRDRSFEIMRLFAQRDPRFYAIKLSRNFGHQMALTAGCDYARGEATITMDSDLQDPPGVILEMAAKWREGYEIVFAVRRTRKVDSPFKRYSALFFYHLLKRCAAISAPVNSADFRLVDRKVLESFQKLREKNRYIRGMFSWLGYKQTEVYFDREARYAGETKYPLWKMVKLGFDALVSFSNVPLRFCMACGLTIAILSMLVGIATIIGKVWHLGAFVAGWASLIVLISFIGGIHLFMLGILGEYLARVYDEVRARPLYLVSELSSSRPTARDEFRD
ncbi:MAG: glycosyltransferase family 2 protein [Chitinophagaceae bacterium]|nr:glycosyltransferase family 2 protein [Oligoflexus sp.]